MAQEGDNKETNISVSQDHFTCAICLGLLKDPVTVPCAHNYCMDCITACWDRQEAEEDGGMAGCRCPQCRMTFTPRPVLCRNPLLAEMVEKLRDTAGGEETPAVVTAGAGVALAAAPGEVECTACVGRKRKADKSCLDCLASYCESHFNRHEELHSGKRHKVVAAAAQLDEKLCSKHSKPLEVWCRTDQVCVCPLCIIDDHKGHDVLTAAAAKAEKQSKLSTSYKEQITQREKELKQLRGAVGPFKDSVKESLDASDETFKELITLLESKFSELKELLKAQEQAGLSEADRIEGGLQNILQHLKQKDVELGQLSHTDDPIHFLQNLPSLCPQDLHIVVGSHNYFGAVNTLVSKLNQHVAECLQKDIDDIASRVEHVSIEGTTRMDLMQYSWWMEIKLHPNGDKRFWESVHRGNLPRGWSFFSIHQLSKNPEKKLGDSRKRPRLSDSCRPKFDKDSAFPHHDISDDGTTIGWRHQATGCFKNDNRFLLARQVFCIDPLNSQHYWEVLWNVYYGKPINIAISYARSCWSIGERESEFGTNDKSWSLCCSNSGFKFQHDNDTVEINSPVTSRVGVFVDKWAGFVAFYGIYGEKATLLHRARARFDKGIYPGFYVDSSTEVKIC